MSCKELDKSDPLVYIRRTNGGSSTGGVIYSWDYYFMSSLPTNDNVRYSRPKDMDGDKMSIPLHEIGNNRYQDVVCKSTHLAYSIGPVWRSAPIAVGDAKNLVDQTYLETTDNPCVLLFTSSANFYQRLPECWPWSCRRWTREITKSEDNEKIVTYYKQNTNGEKVVVNNVPVLSVALTDYNGTNHSATYGIYTTTKNTYGEFEDPQKTMTGYLFYETPVIVEETEEDPIDSEILNKCGCEIGTTKIKMGLEIIPVLCRGTCKLLFKAAYTCYSDDTKYKSGYGTKRVVSPYWSCRINENFNILKFDSSTITPYYYFNSNKTTIPAGTPDAGGYNIDPGVVEIPIDVTEDFLIKNYFVVGLNIIFPRDQYLVAKLIDPDGNQTTLFNGVGEYDTNGDPGQNFIDTYLSDNALISINSNNAPYTGSFIPQDSLLSSRNGKRSLGTYKLRIENYSFYTGFCSNFSIEMGKEVGSRVSIGNITVTLDGTDYASSESFSIDPSKTTVVTGSDYYIEKVNGVNTQIKWNNCDKDRYAIDYDTGSKEVIGKAQKFIDVQSQCCIKCRTADENGQITYFDNAFCKELDKECLGDSYQDIEKEAGCP